MKSFWWLAYRFTGADHAILRQMFIDLRNAFDPFGLCFKTMIEDVQDWQRNPMTKQEAIERMINMSAPGCGCLGLFSLWQGTEPSEGRGFEAGLFAGRKQPTVMLIKDPAEVSEYNQALYLANPANKRNGYPSIIKFNAVSFIPMALSLSRGEIVVQPAPQAAEMELP